MPKVQRLRSQVGVMESYKQGVVLLQEVPLASPQTAMLLRPKSWVHNDWRATVMTLTTKQLTPSIF